MWRIIPVYESVIEKMKLQLIFILPLDKETKVVLSYKPLSGFFFDIGVLWKALKDFKVKFEAYNKS